MRVKFGNATKDVAIVDVTPDNYIVPKGEEGDYHCIIEIKQFDPKTGRRLSKPMVQKFDPKSWKSGVERNLRIQGYDIIVLHDPTKWIEEQERLKELNEAERIAAAKKAEEKRKAEERAEMKKAIIEELKKEGLIKTESKKK